MPFATNVFVNCPFDSEYRPLLRALLFTILDLGFEPRLTLERLNSGETRIAKILELIEDAKFGVHDLSRVQAAAAGEFYRLNMPFELGLDMACRLYKTGQWIEKKCLVLGAEAFDYQAAISDLAGSDIRSHKGRPSLLTAAVRNWLNAEASLGAIGPAAVWSRFNDFMADNFDNLRARGFSRADIRDLEPAELVFEMKAWILGHPA